MHLLIAPDWKELKEMSRLVSPKLQSAQYPASGSSKTLVFFEDDAGYPQKRDVGVSVPILRNWFKL